MFSPLLRISLLALCLTFSACGGGKEEKAKQASSTKTQPAPETPAEVEKPAEEKQEESSEARKGRAETAFRAAYCAASKGDMDGATKSYTDNGFKSRAQFLKVWKFYAKKDAAWAGGIAASVDKKPCG